MYDQLSHTCTISFKTTFKLIKKYMRIRFYLRQVENNIRQENERQFLHCWLPESLTEIV